MFGYGGPIASMHLGRYGFMVENYHNIYYIIMYRHCIVLDTTYFLAILLPHRRHALVSSKTKESKMVYTLHLEREALLRRSGSEKTWRVTKLAWRASLCAALLTLVEDRYLWWKMIDVEGSLVHGYAFYPLTYGYIGSQRPKIASWFNTAFWAIPTPSLLPLCLQRLYMLYRQ